MEGVGRESERSETERQERREERTGRALDIRKVVLILYLLMPCSVYMPITTPLLMLSPIPMRKYRI